MENNLKDYTDILEQTKQKIENEFSTYVYNISYSLCDGRYYFQITLDDEMLEFNDNLYHLKRNNNLYELFTQWVERKEKTNGNIKTNKKK